MMLRLRLRLVLTAIAVTSVDAVIAITTRIPEPVSTPPHTNATGTIVVVTTMRKISERSESRRRTSSKHVMLLGGGISTGTGSTSASTRNRSTILNEAYSSQTTWT
jgi:hypothetical protein